MEPADFSASAPGRLIKSPQGAWAFVPDPLPPSLEPTWEMTELVAQSVGALRQLAGVAHTLPNENLLIRPFLQREAVLSSRIEGTTTTLGQLFVLEAAGEAQTAEPDAREVTNYVSALNYGLERLQTLPVSLPLLCETHERLMAGVRGQNKAPGEFRTVQVWLGGATPQGARFVPPPPPEMREALHAFEKYLHEPSAVHFLVRLACIHYQFEAIHPFMDGNGRIGRLLSSLLLCAEGLMPRPLLYLSGYFERHRRHYYDGLLAVSQQGAWSEWILFFLRGVVEQGNDAVRRSTLLMDTWAELRHRLHEGGATATSLRLLDELFVYPATTTSRVQSALGVSKRTARLTIEKLMEAEILREVTGRQRNRVFVATPIAAILDAPQPED